MDIALIDEMTEYDKLQQLSRILLLQKSKHDHLIHYSCDSDVKIAALILVLLLQLSKTSV
jgi:hypothetical protein